MHLSFVRTVSQDGHLQRLTDRLSASVESAEDPPVWSLRVTLLSFPKGHRMFLYAA